MNDGITVREAQATNAGLAFPGYTNHQSLSIVEKEIIVLGAGAPIRDMELRDAQLKILQLINITLFAWKGRIDDADVISKLQQDVLDDVINNFSYLTINEVGHAWYEGVRGEYGPNFYGVGVVSFYEYLNNYVGLRGKAIVKNNSLIETARLEAPPSLDTLLTVHHDTISYIQSLLDSVIEFDKFQDNVSWTWVYRELNDQLILSLTSKQKDSLMAKAIKQITADDKKAKIKAPITDAVEKAIQNSKLKKSIKQRQIDLAKQLACQTFLRKLISKPSGTLTSLINKASYRFKMPRNASKDITTNKVALLKACADYFRFLYKEYKSVPDHYVLFDSLASRCAAKALLGLHDSIPEEALAAAEQLCQGLNNTSAIRFAYNRKAEPGDIQRNLLDFGVQTWKERGFDPNHETLLSEPFYMDGFAFLIEIEIKRFNPVQGKEIRIQFETLILNP